MIHTIRFTQPDVMDTLKSSRIRKLLSQAAHSRCEALKLESIDVIHASSLVVANSPRFSQEVVEEQPAAFHRSTVDLSPPRNNVECSSHLESSEESVAAHSHHLADETSGRRKSLPHKLAALIEKVRPSAHSARRSDASDAGGSGLEELRREIERLVEVTERATAKDVKVAELQAEIRARCGRISPALELEAPSQHPHPSRLTFAHLQPQHTAGPADSVRPPPYIGGCLCGTADAHPIPRRQ